MIQHVDGNSLYVILDRIRDIFVATYNLDLVSWWSWKVESWLGVGTVASFYISLCVSRD